MLDLRWRASWQAAVTTLSIKSSAICRSIWKERGTDHENSLTHHLCVQQRKTAIQSGPPYLKLLALLVMQPPEFQLNKMSKWWMWQRVEALGRQKRDSWHNTNFKDVPVPLLWKAHKGKTWFWPATKTTHIPLQHPHPAAHLDRSPSPSPAASFCWEPDKKADVPYFHLFFASSVHSV